MGIENRFSFRTGSPCLDSLESLGSFANDSLIDSNGHEGRCHAGCVAYARYATSVASSSSAQPTAMDAAQMGLHPKGWQQGKYQAKWIFLQQEEILPMCRNISVGYSEFYDFVSRLHRTKRRNQSVVAQWHVAYRCMTNTQNFIRLMQKSIHQRSMPIAQSVSNAS